MEKCIPKKNIAYCSLPPWISQDILKAIRRRNPLFSSYKKSGCMMKLAEYKYTRNAIVSAIRASKSEYFQRLHTADTKTFWKMVKQLSNNHASIPFLHFNSESVTDDSTKADILNKEFHNNFNHLKDLASSVMNRLSTQPVYCPMELLCTEDQVYDLIMQLDNQKSSGTDNISGRMLKATIDTTVSTITKLFNMSIRTGTFPSCWKTARVVPIPKKGCRTNPANYRPISILPILSKVLERILHNLIFKHLRSMSPISTRQFGFLPGRSTVSALLTLSNDVLDSLDKGQEIISVFFDLSKAFDSVPHAPLLQKLLDIQINPFLYNLL